MSFELLINEEAKADITQAFFWYENQQAGLGKRFEESIERYLQNITSMPLMYPKCFDDVRAAIVQNFPYIILYRIEEKYIIVFSVFHTSQSPDKLKNID